jgi:hypothetical protein
LSYYAISKIRPFLKDGNYQEAIDELKMLYIYNGNAVHLMHLCGILNNTTYERNMNFKVFIIIIRMIYNMLNEFANPRPDEEKILNITQMLEKGYAVEMISVLQQSLNTTRMEYHALIENLERSFVQLQVRGIIDIIKV